MAPAQFGSNNVVQYNVFFSWTIDKHFLADSDRITRIHLYNKFTD